MKKLIILLLFCYHLEAQDLTKVSLQLSWFDQFQFAGYYIAKEKGFYKEVGLEVDIKPFTFEVDALQSVLDRKVDFSIGREVLFTDKNSENIVSLFALFQASPLALLSKKDTNIKSLKDFNNKRLMVTKGDAGQVSIKGMIQSGGVDLDTLQYIDHTHNINDLINNKTDLISAYISKSPYELQEKGIEYNIFHPKEFGFDLYSDFLYTNRDFAKNNKNVVLTFKEASLRGWKYAYENIDETVDLILDKYNVQKLSKEELTFEANELKKLSYYNTNILGKINKNSVQRIYDLYHILGLANEKVSSENFALYDAEKLINSQKLDLLPKEEDYLRKKGRIKVCSPRHMMPYIDMSEDGSVKGIAPDIFNLISKRSKIDFDIVPTENWSENFDFIKKRKCDMLYFAKQTDKREKYLDFTEPFLETPYIILTTMDKPYIASIDEIKDKTLILIKNGALKEKLEKKFPNIKIITVIDQHEVFKKLRKNKAYAYVGTLYALSYTMQHEGIVDLKISGQLKERLFLSTATRSDEPILNRIMNKALKLVSEQEKRVIQNSWSLVNIEPKTNYALIIKIIIFVLVILIIWSFIHVKLNKLNNKLEKYLCNFKYLFNHTIEAIILFENNKCIDINFAALELFGFKDKESAIGMDLAQIIEKNSINVDLEKAEMQSQDSYELNAITQSGKVFPILVSNKFTTINDKFTRIFQCIDLSELKNKENIIIQQSKMTAVGEMLGNIAHQWRQPLTAISMSATNLRLSIELEEEITNEEILEYAQNTSEQCQYLSKTIDDFRSFLIAAPDTVNNIDLAESVKKVENLVSDAYKNNNIVLSNDLESCFININESKFIQATINILNNARDIFKQRNIADDDRFVFVSLKKKNKSIVLSIKDSGGGIEAEHINKVFEPYFSTKQALSGTGIGLYITHQIIITHFGGDIHVQNSHYKHNEKSYKGAEFIITLEDKI